LEGVESLVAKSLLQQREGSVGAGGGEGEPRVWMLETIHEDGREKLAESGGQEELRRAHALYFASIVGDAETVVKGAQQHEWLAKLEAEHDNLRAALAWAYERARNQEGDSLERDSLELGLRTARALLTFWRMKGYLGDGRAQLERLLDLADETG